MNWFDLISLLLAPLTAVAGWLVGKRKRNNDFLQDMQSSINTLVSENTKLLNEIVAVKTQNATLLVEVACLKKENSGLRRQIDELNDKLENVKTITKIK